METFLYSKINVFFYSDRNVSIFSIELSSGQIRVETQDANTLKGHQEYKLVVRLTDAEGLSCRSVDPFCTPNGIGEALVP